MLQGQKVVCINDTFANFIRAIYAQIPVKGTTYTIREVFLGREKVLHGGDAPWWDYCSRNSITHPIHFMAASRSLASLQNGLPPLKH